MALASGIRAGAAYVEVSTRSNKLERGLRDAQRRVNAFASGVRKSGLGILASGAALSAPLALATRTFAGFDDQMRVVQSVTGATESQFASLTDEALRLGRTTSFTAKQVAEGMTELGRAGFSPDAIIASTESVLALSRATSTELARATEIAGATLRGFGKDVNEIGSVVDVLTATANKSAQSLDDLAEGMKPVAPLARQAGEDIEDVAAALGILANNGIKGSLAGNSLARAYKNLATESKQAELSKLGVEAVDSSGNIRKLSDIINELSQSTSSLGTARKLSIFESLFGRGQAAALTLASSGKEFRNLVKDIRASGGVAVEASEKMDAGIGGSFRKMASAIEGVAISIGKAIEKPVSQAAKMLTDISGVVTKLVSSNGALIRTILKAASATVAFGASLVAVGATLSVAAFAIGGFASVVSGVGIAVGVMGSALAAVLSPIGLISAAFIGLASVVLVKTDAIGKVVQWLGDQFSGLEAMFGETIGAIKASLGSGDIELAGKIMMKSLQVVWTAGTNELKSIWIDLESFLLKSLVKIANVGSGLFSGIKGAISGVIQNGPNGAGVGFAQGLGKGASDTSGILGLIDQSGDSKRAKLETELAELTAELGKLNKNATSGSGRNSSRFSSIQNLIDEISSGGLNLGSYARGSSSAGVFNSRAIGSLQGTSVEQEIAKNTRETKVSNQKILDSIRNAGTGGIRFA